MRKILAVYPTILLGLILGIGLTSCYQKQTEIKDTQTASSTVLSYASLTYTPGVVKELGLAKVTPTTNIILEMLGQVDKNRALADLRQLSGEVPICTNNGCYTISNRLTGSEGLHWAKDYIYEELIRLGYSIKLQDWSRSGYADQNLIARKPGMVYPNEEIYFVAHIDGVKASGEAPAADDNASGVVDLLELARVISSQPFKYTVVLLFSTGEEQGELGVKSYIDQLSSAELSAIKYVIDIDMVGYDANRDGVMELWHGGLSPSLALAHILSDTIKASQLTLAPGFVVGCG